MVPGGGLAPDGKRWISCRPGFFLPVRVLSRLFRRVFLQHLNESFQNGKLQFFLKLQKLVDPIAWKEYLSVCRTHEWVVYAKPPLGGPEQVLDYLSRYTHRVAISNNRLLQLDDGKVSFRYKDYRHHGKQKTMILAAEEFIRRLLLHVLPAGFQRIRQYGLLSSRSRSIKLTLCRQLLRAPMVEPLVVSVNWRARYEAITGESLDRCPICHQGCMTLIEILPAAHATAGIDSS